MVNFGSKILGSAVSSLNAQQAVLASHSNNIANVNTPGYSRRTLRLENQILGDSSGGLNIGSGVKVADIVRNVDEFLNKTLRGTLSQKEKDSVRSEMLGRIDSIIDLTGDTTNIGLALENFFASLDDLALDPSSIELRKNVIERATDLVQIIRTTFNELSSLQKEIDSRLDKEIALLNGITAQIAQLNQKIVQRENNGTVAADERDQRDRLLEELSKLIEFDSTEVNDGSVNITLKNGLDIVFGANYRKLETTRDPSFAGDTSPISLWGGIPSYIVFNFGDSTDRADINLTNVLANGKGRIAGLLSVRGVYKTTDTSAFDGEGDLPELASRIEAITRYLLKDLNTQYLGADEDANTAGHQASAVDLDGNTPAVFGFFDFEYSGTKDVDNDGLPEVGVHNGIDNYSSLLKLAISDPRDIAASTDLDASGGSISYAIGDGSNIKALADFRNTSATFSVGDFSLTGTAGEVFNDFVGEVGVRKSRADNDLQVSSGNLDVALNRRDEVSGVNLDEEFAQLVKFQKAFEASARVINIFNELMDQLVRII